MHQSVRDYVARMVTEHDLLGRSVLEVGSYNVNGTVRDLFTGTYIGMDVVPGPGVDMVADIEDTIAMMMLGPFDVVVSTEMLEHTLRPERALRNMSRLTGPRGVLLVTCRGYDQRGCWEVHHPPDRWRLSDGVLRELLHQWWHVVDVEADPDGPGWLVFAEGRRALA